MFIFHRMYKVWIYYFKVKFYNIIISIRIQNMVMELLNIILHCIKYAFLKLLPNLNFISSLILVFGLALKLKIIINISNMINY